MTSWLTETRYDPIAPLLSSGVKAIVYHTRRDLLGEKIGPVNEIWELPEVAKLLRRQQADGSFRPPGAHHDVYPKHHYPLAETWKMFRFLVDQYAVTKRHPAGERAAEFLFSCQTEAGDIRGMIANQYTTYYTGAILGLLIKAGYEADERVERGMQWLLSMRQDDGGWATSLITHKLSREEQYRLSTQHAKPLEPDLTKPFSHNCTGMVLRAFAAHPKYRKQKPARTAANLLKTRFFKPDCYTSYQSADYWVKFQYPFWWNHLVAALDSISKIGIPPEDPDIQNALTWLIAHQHRSGLWSLSYEKKRKKTGPAKPNEMQLWITLAICRILKRYYNTSPP